MDREALNWEDIALKEAIKLRTLLRGIDLDGRKSETKKIRGCVYNIIEALNKSERTEEATEENNEK